MVADCRPLSRSVRRRLAVAAVAGGAGVILVSAGSAGPNAAKQRIAIVESASVDSGGTFELIPITRGPLKHDTGGVTLSATASQTQVLRGGLRVTPVIAVSTMTSKLGTFKLTQKIDGFEVSEGYSSDRGTWSIRAGTGVYAGVTGSGRLGVVGLSTGQELIRQEGFIHKG